jgi:uncharacterized ion transporter superfamily protein YfcC
VTLPDEARGLFAPIAGVSTGLAGFAMAIGHAILHVPVPSTSGQAVLAMPILMMPILIPLSDLLGLSRQGTVLAYRYGVGFAELLTPTNGALKAMLAAAEVRHDGWLRFALGWSVVLLALGVGALTVGVVTGVA